jgi:intron-binding protein aquarius
VFEACPELRPAFDVLLQRPDKLMLVTGELYGAERQNTEEDGPVDGEVAMEGVEHIGQYVFEMTQTKINQLQAEQGLLMDSSIDEAGEEGQGGYYDEEEDRALEPDILEVREGEAN